MPAVSAKPELSEFKADVCSKSFPRAASVDLPSGVVTCLDDPFWRREKGWEGDRKKLSDASEVQEIASWLLDVKGYKSIETFKPERYQELKDIFEAVRNPPSAEGRFHLAKTRGSKGTRCIRATDSKVVG